MVAETPKLTGMSVAELSPVFDEDFVRPIGAMAHLVLPSVVRTARLDLIRSRGGAPEVVESDVTNLVALDAIVLFANGKVVTLAISPDASFAVDPATATNAVPVAAESHRSQEFGNTD